MGRDFVPSQFSAKSHSLVAGLHGAVLFESKGHAALVPEQVSAVSHCPNDARHVVPAFPAVCVQLPAEQPSTVQGLVSSQSEAERQVTHAPALHNGVGAVHT